MPKIFLEHDENIPILRFSECQNCRMAYGKHAKGLPLRGCCWYDAEFDLFDIKNILDRSKNMFFHLTAKYPFELSNDKNNWFVRFPAVCYNEENDRKNKVCSFFETTKGCLLPVYARPFVCRITLCPQARLAFSPDDYQKVRLFVAKAYRYRLLMLDWLKKELNIYETNFKNLGEVVEALQKLPPLPVFKETMLPIKSTTEDGAI